MRILAAWFPQGQWRRWLAALGALFAVAAFAWLLGELDPERLLGVLSRANPGFLLVLALALLAEQAVRAWKWRLLLRPQARVSTAHLFGAIMAGYLTGLVVPLGASLLVRSWLVARSERLPMPAVLATTALDRLTDGLAFAGFVVIALVFVALPEHSGSLSQVLAVAGAAGFAAVVAALAGLAALARHGHRHPSWAERLPERFKTTVFGFVASFAEGAAWPPGTAARVGVLLAAIVIKALAASHLLWAGLAFGVLLAPAHYVFLLVFLGFLMVLAHAARVPGSFVLGGVFALGLFGVAREPAFAMVLTTMALTVAVVGVAGTLALWQHGTSLAELRARSLHHAADGP